MINAWYSLVLVLLRAKQMLHSTFKFYLCSLVLECVSLFCDCVAYGDYMKTGVGLPLIRLVADMTRAASILTFMFLLILMGKGTQMT